MTYKYIIIGVVLLMILLAILKSIKKDSHLEVNKLIVDYMGYDNTFAIIFNNHDRIYTYKIDWNIFKQFNNPLEHLVDIYMHQF